MNNVVYAVIMIISFVPIAGVLHYTAAFAAKPSADGMVLGLRLSRSGQRDEQVLTLCNRYRKYCRRQLLLCIILFLLIFIIPWASIQICLFVVWAILAFGVYYGGFAHYHKEMFQLREAVPELQPAVADESEKYWKYGLFYYNEGSRDWWTGSRMGVGVATNLARPGCKLILAFSGIAIVFSIGMLGVTVAEEFTPLKYEISEGEIIIYHIKAEAEIALDQIIKTELLDQLPDLNRSNGSSMPALYKGRFYVKGYSGCNLYLNPQEAPFFYIETEENRYLLNATEALQQVIADL